MSVRRCALVFVFLFLLPLGALADDTVEVVLVDGSVLRGLVLEQTENVVVLQTQSAGRIQIERRNIRSIGPVDDPTARRRGQDPDYNTVFFTPTPETVEPGAAYFRNFLLFFLNGGWGVAENLNLSVGTLFPISADLLGLSVGAKWRLLSREEAPLGVAVVAQGTFVEEARFGTIGGVIGIGSRDRSLNLAVLRSITDDSDDDGTIFLIGADAAIADRTKFLIEYGNSTEALGDDSDDDFNGMINVGFRWHGERISFSLTGVRPFEDTGDEFLFLPLTMFSMHF